MLVSPMFHPNTARSCGIGGNSSQGSIRISRRSSQTPNLRLSLRGQCGRMAVPKDRDIRICCSLGRCDGTAPTNNRYKHGAYNYVPTFLRGGRAPFDTCIDFLLLSFAIPGSVRPLFFLPPHLREMKFLKSCRNRFVYSHAHISLSLSHIPRDPRGRGRVFVPLKNSATRVALR